ncbi:hypothetical protein MBLNU459_g5198t1 [Dothideomycetes sp. NU459]
MASSRGPNQAVDKDRVSSDQYMDVIRKNDALRSNYENLLDKHKQLERLHLDLEREYRDLEARAVALRKQHKEDKKLMKDWKAYIDSYYDTARPRLRDASTTVDEPHLATPRALHPRTSGSFAKTATENTPAAGLEGPLAHTAVEAAIDQSRSTSAASGSGANRITSSQTTQGDVLSSEPHYRDTDDDLPVIVSTRSLKRKRSPPGNSRHAAREPPAPPLFIKEEARSSPILEHISRAPLLRTETSDLDVLQADTATPRQKARKLDHARLQRYQQTGKWAQSELQSVHDVNAMVSMDENLAEPDAAIHLANALTPEPPKNYTTNTGTTPKSKAEPAHSDSQHTPRAQLQNSSSQGRNAERQHSGPLQPLSTNTSTLPRTSPYNSKTDKPNKNDQSASAVHLVAEDGEQLPRTAKKTKATRAESGRKPTAAHRLDDLLEHGSSPAPKPAITPRTANPARTRLDPGVTRSIEQPTTSRKAVRDPLSPTKRLILDDDSGPVLPEHEPLRSRPLFRLSIDDFKINPNFNDYRGFAYNETVRKKAERRCLPGCTRECCAEIRKFIEAGGLPNVARRRGLFDSSQDDLDDDELTLQGYLGAGYTRIIKDATAEEKNKMLIDARAKAFADQHGKHRQVYERRNTPPGFWRTDMPTTQEEEEDKEAALQQERQRVEERWREAMRGDGRYVFRDE